MESKTEAILTRDTLGETEKLFGGKHWSQFNDLESLVSLVRAAEDSMAKKNHLKSLGDTYSGMGWAGFKDLIKSKGFIPALEYDVRHGDSVDEFIIYYHPAKGLVICADSYYNKGVVNNGNLYGEIQAHSKEDEETIWKWLSSGGCIDCEKKIYETSHDVREGLFSKLDVLESAGTFLNQWTNNNRFLWFVDSVENKIPGYDYKKIAAGKIAKCPEEFRKVIGR
jgi:hypothetical protein